MTFKVNGGIINSQTLTGSLRFFKMIGPFAWTVSDGSVNLPVSSSGGKTFTSPIISATTGTNQFVIGPGDFTSFLTTGSRLFVTGTTNDIDNGGYSVDTSSYGAPNTTVTVNENVAATLGAGGKLTGLITTYFVVGDGSPVPNSAAELALQEISRQCDIVIISIQPDLYSFTTEIDFACSASAFGWGSDTPAYDVPPADTDEDLTAAAPAMEAAVQALGNVTVYITVGAPDQAAPPVTDVADLGTVTITEVPFALA